MNDGSTILVAPFIGQGVALQSPTSAPGSNGQTPTFDTDSTFAAWVTPLANVVEDTTPQLGGSLDVNGNKIVSVSNGDIDIEPNGTGNVLLGNMTFDAGQSIDAGQDNYVLTYNDGTGLISLEEAAGGGAFTADGDTQITPTTAIVLDQATGNEVALTVNYTVNKATSGSDTGLLVSMTDTNSPGVSLPLDIQVGGVTKCKVESSGRIINRGNWGTELVPAITIEKTDSSFSNPFTSMTFIEGTTDLAYISQGGNDGGVDLSGFTDAASSTAFFLQGHIGSATPSATAVRINGWKLSGSNRTAMTGTQVICSFGAGLTEKVTIDASGTITIAGDINHDGSNLGFYGTAPAAKPTVTGSRGGNAALASLLTALASLGLITDSSSA